MAIAGAVLVLDRDAPYASADDSGTSYGITWTLSEGVLTLSPTNGSTSMHNYDSSGAGSAPWSASANRLSISEVVVKDGITSIGNYAFFSCYSLKSMSIQGNVTSIGDGAFMYCYALSSITIPGGVTTIANFVFYGCHALSSVTFLGNVTTIGAYAFTDCSSLASFDVPSTVTTIVAYAFTDCYSLSEVGFLGNGPASIGASAFAGCATSYSGAARRTGRGSEYLPNLFPTIFPNPF
jgi:hypothetical protein